MIENVSAQLSTTIFLGFENPLASYVIPGALFCPSSTTWLYPGLHRPLINTISNIATCAILFIILFHHLFVMGRAPCTLCISCSSTKSHVALHQENCIVNNVTCLGRGFRVNECWLYTASVRMCKADLSPEPQSMTSYSCCDRFSSQNRSHPHTSLVQRFPFAKCPTPQSTT